MEKSQLSKVQLEILNALESIGDKSTFSEFVLAKKIRENAKLENKKKAGISLGDIETVIDFLAENNQVHYSIRMNSANDILLEKTDVSKPLSPDAKKRRLSSEKSMEIFTSRDFEQKNSNGKSKQKQRSERKKMNIYKDYSDLD